MTKEIGIGTCYSMSRIALLQMRALGLPIAIDYAPSWGNRSEGHYWNALIYKNRSYPLDPTGPNIGLYKIEFKGTDRMPYKISKVFRKTFSIQDSSLLMLVQSANEVIPSVFKSSRIKDVTKEYVPVSDVRIDYSSTLSSHFAYLCTFDNRGWIPSFWGKIDKYSILFRNMGRDIVYLPATYIKSDLVPIGNPFILKSNNETVELKPDTATKQIVIVTRKYPEDQSNNIVKGDKYELFYWDNGWKSLGIKVADNNKLLYKNAPTGALFWIRDLTEGKQERIFTYENNKQIWW